MVLTEEEVLFNEWWEENKTNETFIDAYQNYCIRCEEIDPSLGNMSLRNFGEIYYTKKH